MNEKNVLEKNFVQWSGGLDSETPFFHVERKIAMQI